MFIWILTCKSLKTTHSKRLGCSPTINDSDKLFVTNIARSQYQAPMYCIGANRAESVLTHLRIKTTSELRPIVGWWPKVTCHSSELRPLGSRTWAILILWSHWANMLKIGKKELTDAQSQTNHLWVFLSERESLQVTPPCAWWHHWKLGQVRTAWWLFETSSGSASLYMY